MNDAKKAMKKALKAVMTEFVLAGRDPSYIMVHGVPITELSREDLMAAYLELKDGARETRPASRGEEKAPVSEREARPLAVW
jgi:hypothetical protein